MSTALPCSCGHLEPHPVMTRRSFDGKLVELVSDGSVWIGYQRGPDCGAAPARSADGVARALTVGRLVVDWAETMDAVEITAYLAAGRKMAKAPTTLREIKAAMAAPAPRTAPVVLHWTVVSADRDGRPTERVSVLPRLRWPGMAVFDYCGGPGSKNGRYVLCHRMAGTRDTYTEAFAFRRLADLWAHLEAS